VPKGSFSTKDLGVAIARILDLREGDTVEIARNKLDRNDVRVIRHPASNEENMTEVVSGGFSSAPRTRIEPQGNEGDRC
jgi:hypothetical protein